MEAEKCTECGHDATNNDKWRWTLYTTVLFLILVNPMTYKLVHKLLGKIVKIADGNGCPTMSGMLIHAAVFTVLLRFLMDLKI